MGTPPRRPATTSDGGRWRRRVRTAREVRRAIGVRGVAFLLLRRVAPSPWIHPEWFVVMEHDPRTTDLGGDTADMRWGSLEDIPALLAGERDERTLRARFARGDRVAMLEDSELVGYAWYRRGQYDEQGILFPLGEGEAWGYDGWVAPPHRGRGQATRMFRGTSRALAREGISRVLLCVDHLNTSSLRATRAGGRVPIGSIVLLRVLGTSLRRDSWVGMPPRWNLYRGTRAAAVPAQGPAAA